MSDRIPMDKPIRPQEKQRRMIQWVADCYGVHADRIRLHDRRREFKDPRYMCFFLLYQVGQLSMERIGIIMGGFHHTTVSHGVDKITGERKRDPRVEKFIEGAQQILGVPEVGRKRALIADPIPVKVEAA